MVSKSILKTRKNIILYAFIEIILIIFSYSIVFYLQKDVNYSHIYSSLVILFWPIVSYIANRYENIFFREKFFDSTYKLIISSLAIIFLYSFSATILDLLKIYKEEFKVAYSYIFLLKTLSINFIFCILLKFISNNASPKKKNKKNWFYIGKD